MKKALADRIEQRVRSAFPGGAITRVQVLEYGDDPEVEPAQAAMRVFFEWAGRSEGGKADPQTVHAFVTANSTVLGTLRAELPRVIRWVEFRPENLAGEAGPHGLSYRITDRGPRAAAPDQEPEDLTPVMTRLGPADLATLDGLITAGIVNSRAEGLRWAVSDARAHRRARQRGWAVIYIIDGRQVGSLEDFYRVMGEAVNGPGGYFGSNLDAFNDCLRGGYGTPEDGDFAVEWRAHEVSRINLGYEETVRQLELRLARCHPSSRPHVQADLDAARAGQGPTVFDWLVEIFEDQLRGRLLLR
jgi:RNAse (barnase) inhibitor barstar